MLAIFTDVFDCFFRFLSALLEEDGKLGGEEFWRTAAAVVRDYQDEHPELAEQFARHDLFADGVRAVLPQPAAAAQQPADGGPGRPVRRTADGRPAAEPAGAVRLTGARLDRPAGFPHL